MKNNFDTSSSGVQLELSCFYARSFFEDDIERIEKTRDSFFFIAGGQYSMEGMYTLSNRKDFIEAFCNDYHTIDDTATDKELNDLIHAYEYDNETPGVKEKYPFVEVRGYSQGDYAKVYYDTACLNDNWKEKDLGEYLHHIFYDSPIYCRLTIDGEEFAFEEYMKDTYEYDEDEILTIAKEHIEHDKKEYIMQWLSDNLPTTLDYL